MRLDKCETNMPTIDCYRMIFSKDGVSPDPKKVQAIKKLSSPSHVAKLGSFLGMVNYIYTSTKVSPHCLLFDREPVRKLPYVTVNDDHDNNKVSRQNRPKRHMQITETGPLTMTCKLETLCSWVMIRNPTSYPFSPKHVVIKDIKGTVARVQLLPQRMTGTPFVRMHPGSRRCLCRLLPLKKCEIWRRPIYHGYS